MLGKTISHYKILEKLGKGGMGVVYKAEDTGLERTVAFKVFALHLVEDQEAHIRFIHEAKAAAVAARREGSVKNRWRNDMRNMRQPYSVPKTISVLICAALIVMATPALAQDGAVGTWDLTYRIPQGDSSATLTISQGDDGQLAGEWTSEPGTSTLSEMKFADGKLTFVRKLDLRRRVIVSKFAGKIEGNQLTGALTSDALGEQSVSGKRR